MAQCRTLVSPVERFEARLQPHAECILVRSGFDVRPLKELEGWAHGDHEPTTVITVRTSDRVAQDARYSARWRSEQVRVMTLGRYRNCWATVDQEDGKPD